MAISEDNKRISVKLTKEQYEQIKEIATDKDRSVSNYIGYLVKKHLKEFEKLVEFLVIEKGYPLK